MDNWSFPSYLGQEILKNCCPISKIVYKDPLNQSALGYVIQNQTKPEGVRLETDLSGSNFDAAMTKRAINNMKNVVQGQSVGNYTKSYETWRRVSNVVNSFKEELSTEKTAEWQVLDLGCGDGYHLMLLSSLKETRETKVHFHGIDISPANVMLAKQVAQDLRIRQYHL